MASLFLRFLDHTQRRTTVGRTPLDERSARCRDLYLTTHNTHNRQTSMTPVGFEPTISAGERPQTYALDRAATGTGNKMQLYRLIGIISSSSSYISVMELGHLLTRSGLTYPEVSSKVCHDSFSQLGNSVICPASFRETCQWLKFPPNGLRAQSRVSPVVGLLPSASGRACLGMAFPRFLMKQLYRCDSVVISSFVRTWYTTRR